MAKNVKRPLEGLLIRAAAVRAPDLGFIIAADPKLEKQDAPHAISFRWKEGVFNHGRAKFDADSICIIDDPEYGVVKTSDSGFYSVETRSGVAAGNIFVDSSPPAKVKRYD